MTEEKKRVNKKLTLTADKVYKKNIPDNIETLIIENRDISKIPNFPKNLKNLELINIECEELPHKLPDSLETLTLDASVINTLNSLPDKLKIIEINYSTVNKLILPKNLKKFNFINSTLNNEKAPELPQTLEELNYFPTRHSNSPLLTPDDILPNSLKKIDTAFNLNTGFLRIPPNLEMLHLSDTSTRDKLPYYNLTTYKKKYNDYKVKMLVIKNLKLPTELKRELFKFF